MKVSEVVAELSKWPADADVYVLDSETPQFKADNSPNAGRDGYMRTLCVITRVLGNPVQSGDADCAQPLPTIEVKRLSKG